MLRLMMFMMSNMMLMIQNSFKKNKIRKNEPQKIREMYLIWKFKLENVALNVYQQITNR